MPLLLCCSDAWLPIASNHTFAGDPTPRVDKLYDGGPLKGWMPSSGYNAIVALGPDSALVCYDQMGWGGGNYGIGLPPIFGSQGEWVLHADIVFLYLLPPLGTARRHSQ